MKRSMSAPPSGCRFECWECGIPVYYDRYFECILCVDCRNLYRPFNSYYDSRGRLFGWVFIREIVFFINIS